MSKSNNSLYIRSDFESSIVWKILLLEVNIVEARVRKEDWLAISTNFTESSDGLVVMDHQNPTMKIIVKG